MPGRAPLRPGPERAGDPDSQGLGPPRKWWPGGAASGTPASRVPPAQLGEAPEDKPMRTPRPQDQFSGRWRAAWGCEGVAKTPSPCIHRSLRPPLTRTDNIGPQRQPSRPSPVRRAPGPGSRAAHCPQPPRQRQTRQAAPGRPPDPGGGAGGAGPVGGAGRSKPAQGRPPPQGSQLCSSPTDRKAFCSLIKGDVWDRVDSGPPHAHLRGQQGGGRACPWAQGRQDLVSMLAPGPHDGQPALYTMRLG